MGGNLTSGGGGNKADHPDSLARILNQTGPVKAVIFLIKDRFRDLLDAAIDRAHHGHAAHQTFSPTQQRPPHKAFSEPAHNKGEHQKDNEAKSANVILVAQLNIEKSLDIAIGLIAVRDNRPDPRINPPHNRPNQPSRQPDWRDNHQACKEV